MLKRRRKHAAEAGAAHEPAKAHAEPSSEANAQSNPHLEPPKSQPEELDPEDLELQELESHEQQSDVWVGRALHGGYRIDARLGAGGVGAVYRGTQLRLERPVAIKILHEGLHPSFAARFEREAMALAALRHPNIVTVTDYGVDKRNDAAGVEHDTPFIVMELLEGETLHYQLTQGPLAPQRVFELARDLLRALSFVHEQGLVHRDLKPGNIFLEKLPHDEQRLRLLDFGLAKFIDGSRGSGEVVTRQGDIVGTPAYMAPEQIAGDVVDARTDTYAVGVVLFQMLAGRTPYEGAAVDMLTSHLVSPVPSLKQKRPSVTARPELEALLARALSKQRDARFQTCTEMLNALEAIEQPWLQHDESAEKDPAFMRTMQGPARDDSHGASHAGTTLLHGSEPSTAIMLRRVQRMVPIAAGVFGLLVIAFVLWVRPVTAPSTSSEPSPSRDPVHERAHERASDSAPALRPLSHPRAAASGEVAAAAAVMKAREAKENAAVPTQAPVPVPATAPAAIPAEPVLAPAAPVAAAAPQASARVPARNPWARAVPRALIATRKAALSGDRGSERTVNAMRRYNRDNSEDPRGHLLLALLYRNRKWRDDALKQYVIVDQLDPSARGAPEMLPELLQLFAQGDDSGDGAGRLIENAYGREALPAIDRAIAALKKQKLPDVLARMIALRAAVAR